MKNEICRESLVWLSFGACILAAIWVQPSCADIWCYTNPHEDHALVTLRGNYRMQRCKSSSNRCYESFQKTLNPKDQRAFYKAGCADLGCDKAKERCRSCNTSLCNDVYANEIRATSRHCWDVSYEQNFGDKTVFCFPNVTKCYSAKRIVGPHNDKKIDAGCADIHPESYSWVFEYKQCESDLCNFPLDIEGQIKNKRDKLPPRPARPNITVSDEDTEPLPTVKPATVKPTTVKPTTVKPTTVKPATVKPTTVKPATVKPTTVKPATVKPTTVKPATVKPTTVKPATVKPTTVKPTTEKATTVKPAEEPTDSTTESDTPTMQTIKCFHNAGDEDFGIKTVNCIGSDPQCYYQAYENGNNIIRYNAGCGICYKCSCKCHVCNTNLCNVPPELKSLVEQRRDKQQPVTTPKSDETKDETNGEDNNEIRKGDKEKQGSTNKKKQKSKEYDYGDMDNRSAEKSVNLMAAALPIVVVYSHLMIS